MSTEAPVAVANPGKAMEGFISSLQSAGTAEAAKAAAEKPAPETKPDPAPPKPPEKPADIKPAPDAKPETAKETSADEIDLEKWPRDAKGWDAYKSKYKEKVSAATKERDDIKTERNKLNDEIEKLRKQGPSPELDKMKQERDQLSEQLRLVSVENHPKFKAYFENKTTAQVELAKRIVGTENADRIAELLKTSDGPTKDAAIEEIMATLSPLQASRLGGVVNAMSEIQSERQSEIGRSRETYDKMQKEQADKTAGEQKRVLDLFDSTVKEMSDPKNGNPLFQTKDGDEAWNGEVNKRIETAKNLLFGNTQPEQVIRAAMDVVAYPAVLKQNQAQAERIGQLEAQVKELTAAAPKVEAKAGEKSTDVPGLVTHKSGTSPMDAVKGWVGGLNKAQQ